MSEGILGGRQIVREEGRQERRYVLGRQGGSEGRMQGEKPSPEGNLSQWLLMYDCTGRMQGMM